ncbi:hypothetical protein BH11ARM2_BH11ARM2_26430 [soil metagenome]
MVAERAYRMTARVGAGHRVEFFAPELAEGEVVELFVMPQVKEHIRGGSFLDLLDSFPAGPRSAATWEEVETNLQADRDSWTQ